MKVLLVKRILLLLAGICSIYYIVAFCINRDDTIESFGDASPPMLSDLEQSVKDLCKWLFISIFAMVAHFIWGGKRVATWNDVGGGLHCICRLCVLTTIYQFKFSTIEHSDEINVVGQTSGGNSPSISPVARLLCFHHYVNSPPQAGV